MSASKNRLREASFFVLGLLLVGALAKLYTRATEDHYSLAAQIRLKVDLNRDEVERLSTLPAIGPTLARRIVEEREKGGPYQTLEEAAERVSGMGSSVIEEVRDYVIFGPPLLTSSKPEDVVDELSESGN